ncbi:SDR family NAD(P)-dependent oxidoreductase [Nocardia camponoti]|nr:SDR family oxidoreductase [Nocardia camponoti]
MLTGKVAVVVGAGAGIGRSVASGLAAAGAIVHCLDIDADNARSTAKSIKASGGIAKGDHVDVRLSESVNSSLAAVTDEHGQLDIVICTPGINIRKPLLRYSDDDYDAVMDVNLRGSFNTMRAAGQIMVPQRTGSIVVFSSISSRVVEPGQVIYAGTKAALAQMVRVFAAELGPYGVRVNAIGPGPTATELTLPIRSDKGWHDAYADRTAVGRWADPAELAGPAVFLCSDAASYVNGQLLYVDGGWIDIDRRYQGGPVLDGVEP